MFRNILILASILFLSNVSAQIPSVYIGSWEGKTIEEGRADPYNVSLTINSVKEGEIAGTIWYKDYNCGGNLKFLGIEKGLFLFEEILTTKEDCIDNGHVVLLFSDEELFYIWGHNDYDHKSEGILKRKN